MGQLFPRHYRSPLSTRCTFAVAVVLGLSPCSCRMTTSEDLLLRNHALLSCCALSRFSVCCLWDCFPRSKVCNTVRDYIDC